MKLRALIIDDDENLLFLANKFLKNYYENLEIVPIDNSQDAIKMLGKESYDAVICDYNLGPDQMNGLEILEWFRK
ncbi:MAG: response regulator, partial [Candidatus Thorarchaeota archaeon]|nr:response regulator [Candidatus Thorarchaeota archaeon]